MKDKVELEVMLEVDGELYPFELKVSEGELSLLPVGGFSALETEYSNGVVYEFFDEFLSIYRFRG